MSALVEISPSYPSLLVPTPADGEWLDFIITTSGGRHLLWWRLNDGDRDDPDTVDYGFISGHRWPAYASEKRAHLMQRQAALGIAA